MTLLPARRFSLGHLGAAVALSTLLAVQTLAAAPQDLATKEVFTLGWPQDLAFRGEYIKPTHKNYAAWLEAVQNQAGVIRKFVPEELTHLTPEAPAWATRYASEHPKKLLLLHFNGEARQITTDASVHQRYFPGHWVYQPGSRLHAPLAADATMLSVDDIRPFKVDAYLDHGDNDDGKRWFPQILALTALDEQGLHDWAHTEFVIVTAIDRAGKTITVKRGQLFSRTRAHAATRTVVAPLAAGIWGGAPMAFYNLSTACPRDAQGRTAADVLVRELTEWLGPAGPLAAFHGIAFDVNYWHARDASWDVDNDGRSDGGLLHGTNTWRLGDWQFLRDLRLALGDGRLITADGQLAINQQAVGLLDGIESEGLVQHNDGFRGFSRTVNTHLYWAENNPRPHDFRYIVLKLKNPTDEARGDSLRRLAVGTAYCLGARTTAIPAGVLPAAFAQPGSLGRPVGHLLRPVRQTPDLLGGAGLAAPLAARGGTLARRDGAIELIPDATANAAPMTVTLRDLAVPAGDLTLVIELQALDPLDGFPADSFVPRQVSATFSRVPDYGEKRYNSFYAELYGFIGTHRPSVLAFYLRRPGQPAQTLDVTFTLEGRGRARLTALTAHAAADTLVREFTHGVVAVNPSLAPLAIALPQTTGGNLPETVTVPALDAAFLVKH